MANAVIGYGVKIANVTVYRGQQIVKLMQPKLLTFWRYAKVEIRPPTLRELPQDTTLNTMVALEIVFWFFVGEIIGRGNIVGYYIPGAVHYGISL